MLTSQSGLFAAILLAVTLVVVFQTKETEAQLPPLCHYCNTSQIRCSIGYQCCNYGKKNAQCLPNTLTCEPAIECTSTQVQCGTDCNGVNVWCGVDEWCCNPCQGANVCVPNGQTCIQGGCGCPPA